LLDFYGTVVDEDDEVVASICARAAATGAGEVSPGRISEAWWRAFQAAMTATPFRLQRDIAVESLALALTENGCGADAAALCEEQFRYWRTAPLRPGTRAFLDSVRMPICVLSNIDRADVEAALSYHRLSFAAVVTSEDVGAYKPAPQMFLRGLELLGLPADEVVHIGDSLTADIAGAQAAGIAAIWVNRRGRPAPDGIDVARMVDNLGELVARLPHRRRDA
jgi:2-haloacid dehalogenase/putative hydrolase of the HAD superfamily